VINRVLLRLQEPKQEERYVKARFLNMLGAVHLYRNQLDEAEYAYETAYELFAGRINERTAEAAESLKGRASVAVAQKEPERALELYQKALAIAKDPNVMGNRRNYDPRPAASLQAGIANDIGILYLTKTNSVEARKWLEEAQEDIEKNFGKTAAELEPILKNLARSYSLERDYKKAEEILIRSLLVDDKMKGGAISFAESSIRLAAVLFEQDDAALDPIFARLLSGDSKTPRPESFLTCAMHMARYFAEKDWARAVSLMDRALAANDRKFGTGDERSAQFLRFAAELSTRHKSPSNTERYLLTLVERIKQSEGPSSAALAEPYKRLAEHYAHEKSFSKAEDFYTQEIAVLQRTFGEKDSRLAGGLEDKAAFLESIDQGEHAKELRARANRIRGDALLNGR